jgi:DNA processing protein
MVDYDELLAWSALAHAPGLDPTSVSAALELLGGAHACRTSPALELQRAGLPPAACAFLTSPTSRPGAALRRWLETPRHHLIPFTHERFPRLLRELSDCPLALYVCGNPAALEDPQLAVVGTRNPTAQGKATAFEFAETLAERGLGITSGVAEGIDTCAHRGAVRAQGITLGVLGTGVDVVYPASNQGLCSQIVECGALISEFPLGTPPRRGNFPQRNRIIAGLSLGTLVVEAAQRSGSLITARLANSFGREVFAVPGSIANPMSRGCHALIKAGATLAESAEDILRELNFSAFFGASNRTSTGPAHAAPHTTGMDKDHKILLDALGFDPVDLDTLIVRTGFKPDAVSSMMLILELEGHVQAAPGGRYSRVANRRATGER